MALSDLAVFQEYAFTTATEVLAQQIELFNAASRGTIVLRSSAHRGDFSEEALFGKIAGLVRRRDPYATGAVAATSLASKKFISVKVAAGTKPVEINPGQFRWIQQNPRLGGAVIGQQLAGDMMADMLNPGIAAAYAALAQVTELVYDGTAGTFDAKTFVKGARKFGDRSNDLAAWVMHSSPVFDLYESNMNNTAQLFNYGTVRIVADPFGNPIIVTDSPSLVEADGVGAGIDMYHSLGLVPGALMIDQNNDFDSNIETSNGDENIARTYQAEWSYNLGIKGFAWDTANGGKAPDDAAIATATNWDRFATSEKDLAGVVVETR